VKPRQGGAGYGASLKAKIATIASGRNKKAKKATPYNTVLVRSQSGRGREAIMSVASLRQTSGH
jgi:hypothetical protein